MNATQLSDTPAETMCHEAGEHNPAAIHEIFYKWMYLYRGKWMEAGSIWAHDHHHELIMTLTPSRDFGGQEVWLQWNQFASLPRKHRYTGHTAPPLQPAAGGPFAQAAEKQ